MSLVPTSPFLGTGPEFNRAAADAVYGQLMKMDADSATVYGRMLVGATVQSDMIVHSEEIAAEVGKVFTERTAALRAQLVKTSIAKARAGEDNTAQLAALVELSKAGFLGPMFSHFMRSQRTSEQERNPQTGRFVVMHEPIHHAADDEVIPGRYAGNMGIPKLPTEMEGSGAGPGTLTPQQKAQFQHGYLQIQRLLRPYAELPAKAGIATFHYADELGDTWAPIKGDAIPVKGVGVSEVEGKGKVPTLDATKTRGIDPARKVTSVTVHVMPPTTAAGGLYAGLNALGFPKLGAAAAGATRTGGALNADGLTGFESEWNRTTPQDQFTPSNTAFRRLIAGSKLVENSLGETAPPQVKMALSVAQHIGSVGPAAQKIVGPTMDRAAYRYRGTERAPDKALLTAVTNTERDVERSGGDEARLQAMAREQRQEAKARLDSSNRMHAKHQARIKGEWDRDAQALQRGMMNRKEFGRREKQHQKDLEQASAELAESRKTFARTVNEARLRDEQGATQRRLANVEAMRAGGLDADNLWQPSPVLTYFKNRVPDPALNDLQLKSGVVPPSEGIILDGDGQIKHQTVGYGDDHYLPFTLRNLAALRGGYYIRTRTFGGPTSEDIYTALISGAKGLTVVSNNGTFVIDFDHDFKGGRRFNDKAARMVGRYGHLLDAVKSGYVPGAELDPSRIRELHQRALREMPGNPQGQRNLVEQLKADERQNPTLSVQQHDEAAAEYLNGEFERLGLAEGNDREAAGRRGGIVGVGRRTHDTGLSLDEMAERLAAAKERQVRREFPDATGEVVRAARDKKLTELQRQPAKLAEAIAAEMGISSGLKRAIDDAGEQNRKNLQPLQLDGHGYDVAMQALKQQFPYYIANTRFERWGDGVDRKDTGYVKPKFNRPGEAMAGYFDGTIGNNGGPGTTGKYSADSIRNQNAQALHAAPLGNRAERTEQQPTGLPTDAPMGSATAGGLGVPGQTALTAGSPAQTMAARERADRAMLEHLLELRDKPLGPGFFYEPARGLKIAGVMGSESVPQQVRDVFGQNPDEIRLALERNPDPVRVQMKRALDWVQAKGAYTDTLNRDVTDTFLNDGRAAPVRNVLGVSPEDMMAAIRKPHAENNFRSISPVYMKGDLSDPQDILDVYEGSPDITHLVEAGRLPDEPAPEAVLKAAVDKLSKELDAAEAHYAGWKRRGEIEAEPTKPSVIMQEGYAMLKAAQLGRRYQEAVARQVQAAAQQEAEQAEMEAEAAAAAPKSMIAVFGADAIKQLGEGNEEAGMQNLGNLQDLLEGTNLRPPQKSS